MIVICIARFPSPVLTDGGADRNTNPDTWAQVAHRNTDYGAYSSAGQDADGFKLWFLDVQHFSGRTLTDRNSTLWGGFMLEINGKKLYFGGDSGYADHYQRTYDHFGPVDIAFLPIGAYAPRSFFKPVHLNPTEAMQAHQDLHAELSIGMHYGTFQLSAEPREEPVQRLASAREKAGVSEAAFVTLEIGEPFEVNGGGGGPEEGWLSMEY